MPEDNDKNIRIPVPEEERKHTLHKVRTITISLDKGIKALYCLPCENIITYLFAKNKNWTLNKSMLWVSEQIEKINSFTPVHVDQEVEFIKILASSTLEKFMAMPSESYFPKSDSFILVKEIEDITTGSGKGIWDKARGDGQGTGGERQNDGGADSCTCPDCGATASHKKGTPCTETECPKCGKMMVGKATKCNVESEETMEIIKFGERERKGR